MQASDESQGRKGVVFLPSEFLDSPYVGELWGVYNAESDVFNIVTDKVRSSSPGHWTVVGAIHGPGFTPSGTDMLSGIWKAGGLEFSHGGKTLEYVPYSLRNDLFSTNHGILDHAVMERKRVAIAGCGAIGSRIALELARSGVAHFLLIDPDIIRYDDVYAGEFLLPSVGQLKVCELREIIKKINPDAMVSAAATAVAEVGMEIMSDFLIEGESLMIACTGKADEDASASDYAMGTHCPFIAAASWENSFNGDLFYWQPDAGHTCFRGALSTPEQRKSLLSTRYGLDSQDGWYISNALSSCMSADISTIANLAAKLSIDILNNEVEGYYPRIKGTVSQYTVIFNQKPDHSPITNAPLECRRDLSLSSCSGCTSTSSCEYAS